jgi:outer membrane protein TolC
VVSPRRLYEILAALAVALPGCATRELARAPARPDEAWTIPEDSDYGRALRQESHDYAAGASPENQIPGLAAAQAPTSALDGQKNDAAPQNRVLFEPGRKYLLAELIDVAERNHPDTREAWEKARQAALAVGLAERTYLPQLTANVIAGFQRTPLPFPPNLVPGGTVVFSTREVVPAVAASWLLFDFGQREAEVQEAKAKSFVANVTFTEAHEKIIFEVSRDYFALGAARARVRVAEHAAANARRTQDITESRHAQGVATVVDVAQARRETAQTHFDLVRARGAERTAYSALVASLGVAPNGPIEVADLSDRPLPAAPMPSVLALVEKALVNRPDVVAALGKVRAAEAGLRRARAAYWPTIGVNALLYENIAGWSTGGPYFTVNQPGYATLLSLELLLFDGGGREARIAVAHSEVSAARAALDGARDRAVQEVTSAYDQLQTSLAEYQAAVAVDETAATALDAATDAYRSGVGLLTDVISAENGASEAQTERETSRANVFTSAAALAFAVGSVTRR